jgi:DNA invertase Pin-like site-specific DNA recombinase
MKKPRKKWGKKNKVLVGFPSSVPWIEPPKGSPMMLGYVRVSMSHQNTQRQVDDLVRAGVAPVDIFGDHASGKDMERPGWKACVRDLQAGDMLVIHSLDRLSRNVVDTMTTLEELAGKGVRVKVLTLDFDSQTPIGRFVFTMMSAFAQLERETIQLRTLHGLESARLRGRIGGAKLIWTKKQVAAAYKVHKTYEATAKALGCARITVVRKVGKPRDKAKAEKEFKAIIERENP